MKLLEILNIIDLYKYYPIKTSFISRLFGKKLWVHAVDGVTLEVRDNETVGLVGESGSGKTTLGRTVLMLEKPTRGRILFKGAELTGLSENQMRLFRRKLQVVFQNPSGSLDPRQRVSQILAEPLKTLTDYEKKDIDDLVSASIRSVGLSESFLTRFPHELSGGQKQRIAIARALVLNPELIVLDEPTSALDASVQLQILNLLRELQVKRRISYLFITHNISVVRYMADRVAVMYAGKIMEVGPTRSILEKPLHPYTSTLIASVPEPDPNKKLETKPLKDETLSMVNPPTGCRFHPRCPFAQEICRREVPELRKLADGRIVACHLA
ncbi:MAG: ABC transporter ATP-binding protein [Thermoprotei archaeon]